MKTINTAKLYEKMTSIEKANIYQATADQAERDKILASVPRLTYSALDYEFTNKVDRLNFEQLTLMVDYFRTVALLTEAYHEGLLLKSDVHKQLANLHLSKLASVEKLLDANHKDILTMMGQSIDAEGYAMVYDLEVQPELVEQFDKQLEEIRNDVINKMFF